MKRFIWKLLSGALALLVVIAGLNALYIRTEYFHDLNDVAKFRELPERIEAVNLGNSHSLCAFDWSLYPDVAGANMALGAQTHDFDYAILCQYADRFSESAVLFLDISGFSLYIDALTGEEYTSAQSRYYAFLKRRYIPNYRLDYEVMYGLLPVLSAQPNQLAEAFFSYEKKEATEGDLPAMRQAYGEDHMIAGGRARAEHHLALCLPPAESVQYDFVKSILETCCNKKLRVVMVNVPTTPYYYEAFPQEFREAFRRDVETLLAACPGAVYLDYMGDPRFSDLSLYRDYDHLNAAGSALFMRTLFDDLKAYGIDVAGSL